MKYLCVVGARPNFMKISPIINAFKKEGINYALCHTGQHYDDNMSKIFFEQLALPNPDVYLGVGSDSDVMQTARIMEKFERVLLDYTPDVVIVVGDVNSTLACALTASKMNIKVVHVEAGLRSFNRAMPEEINRIVADHLSDLLFTTSEDANQNLVNEGIDKKRIHFVGNVMIDTLFSFMKMIDNSDILNTLNINEKYFVVTIHRPSNVDNPNRLLELIDIINQVKGKYKIIFPIHPRTKNNISAFGLIEKMSDWLVTEPLGYLDFMKLIKHSTLVITDSGGIQEETTVLGVPCVTLREETERPVTVTEGTNYIAGTCGKNIQKIIKEALTLNRIGRIPNLWDGRAAERIVNILVTEFGV